MIGSVRVKVCGLVHPDDAKLAVNAGADLLGLNFVPGSPLCLDLAQAEAIAKAVEGHVERVAVFQNPDPHDIERVTRRIDIERIQFHGDETPEEVEQVDYPVIKAIRGADSTAADVFPGTILLLDHPDEGGGSGKAWNWADAADLIASGHDIILAGGLDPTNIAEALRQVGDVLPWGVDVATGVEGDGHRKDPAKMEAFIKAVRQAEEIE